MDALKQSFKEFCAYWETQSGTLQIHLKHQEGWVVGLGFFLTD